MKWITALKLGRVSNLPTVWSNTLAGAALVNPQFNQFNGLSVFTAAIALSLLYIAGMFLNDVFDFEWDRKHQPKRPLVAGQTTVKETVAFSSGLIMIALVLLAFTAGARALPVLFSAAALIILIMLYDWKHKEWSFSPWLMGGCRLLVYLTAGAIVGTWNHQVLVAGLCLLCYIAGITYVARMEHLNTLNNLWPVILLFIPVGFVLYLGIADVWSWLLVVVLLLWLIRTVWRLMPGKQRRVPQAISALLAGIALIDTAILVALHQHESALLAAGCFGLCLLSQRKIAAT